MKLTFVLLIKLYRIGLFAGAWEVPTYLQKHLRLAELFSDPLRARTPAKYFKLYLILLLMASSFRKYGSPFMAIKKDNMVL